MEEHFHSHNQLLEKWQIQTIHHNQQRVVVVVVVEVRKLDIPAARIKF